MHGQKTEGNELQNRKLWSSLRPRLNSGHGDKWIWLPRTAGVLQEPRNKPSVRLWVQERNLKPVGGRGSHQSTRSGSQFGMLLQSCCNVVTACIAELGKLYRVYFDVVVQEFCCFMWWVCLFTEFRVVWCNDVDSVLANSQVVGMFLHDWWAFLNRAGSLWNCIPWRSIGKTFMHAPEFAHLCFFRFFDVTASKFNVMYVQLKSALGIYFPTVLKSRILSSSFLGSCPRSLIAIRSSFCTLLSTEVGVLFLFLQRRFLCWSRA